MNFKEAAAFIKFGDLSAKRPQVWADLGCGEGIFTMALASLLPNGSTIYAMDSNRSSLANLPDEFEQVDIEKLHGDFTEDKIPGELDGVLMANSLHYVEYKSLFLRSILENFKAKHRFVIVEYATSTANPWIPYPVKYDSLERLFNEAGYKNIEMLRERPAQYGNQKMYSALVKNNG